MAKSFSKNKMKWLSVDGSRFPQVDTTEIRQRFEDMSIALNEMLEESPEKTLALQKLIESKDCAVRAYIDQQAGNNEAE